MCVLRGCEDAPEGGGEQVPQVLADAGPRVPGGGLPGPVPRPQRTAAASDPKHGHHDGHVRGRRVPVLATPAHVMGSAPVSCPLCVPRTAGRVLASRGRDATDGCVAHRWHRDGFGAATLWIGGCVCSDWDVGEPGRVTMA